MQEALLPNIESSTAATIVFNTNTAKFTEEEKQRHVFMVVHVS
jgi:hypothetical protein